MGRFRSKAEKEPFLRTYGTLCAICYIIAFFVGNDIALLHDELAADAIAFVVGGSGDVETTGEVADVELCALGVDGEAR